MNSNLKGKIAFISGATSGIGRRCAVKLAQMGAKVIAAGRREDRLTQLKEELEQEGHSILCLVMDVSSSKDVFEKIESLPRRWKDIDILINNAGLALGTEKLYESSAEDFDRVIDTNVKGVLYLTKAIVPQMIDRGCVGTIVNMGSVAGNTAYAGGAVYCASKAAVRYISDGLRIDLMDTPIRVTNVEPGMVETEFSIVRYRGDKAKADRVYEGIQALTAEDIADSVAYICNLPDNVQIPEIILTPAHQADALNKYIKK